MSRLQIDMLPVGDSDALLMEVQLDGRPEVYLIDGGRNWEDGERILLQLRTYYGGKIDHLILSHVDAHHAAGLLHVVENLPEGAIGQAWVHDMTNHGVNVEAAVRLAAQLTEEAQSASVRTVAEHQAGSVRSVQRLLEVLKERNIPVREAFADGQNRIGALDVLGPTQDFFARAVEFYGDVRMLRAMVEEGVVFKRRKASSMRPRDPDESLEQAGDDPESIRQASLILRLDYEGDGYLFTGDAGREAFAAVGDKAPMADLHLLKVPNHGDKHNLSPDLLDFFKPAIAYISASGISIQPHPDLVAALENRGTVVYTTARSGNVWHRRGDVPPRSGFETKTPR